ncbi:GNAT family N-acetyltransferase [Paenibacillus sp. BC26]|uniref:GNAT family N-acetyltransferase n=1 Tax=Paenibacillus sp. BC26 TaxID=1881032 RepID=UPI0008EA5058|nr:GNAT family N-acetyltransferase [Paenibacillus sp. BC26]SFT09826.1 Ribosomal protein S18 acetylase RimI [Paenibacillus sp. BC26]
MLLYIGEINADVARDILDWKYGPPYDFYNNELSSESLDEFLSGSYFAVCDRNQGLIGFFCVGISAQVPNDSYTYSPAFTDLGIGMRPDYTGQGKGTSFLSFVLSSMEKSYGSLPKRLTVATFNKRAIHLYEKFGFCRESEFIKGSTSFITMIQKKL